MKFNIVLIVLYFQFFTGYAQVLKGIKIALDPGHVSKNMEEAFVEKKYVKFPLDSFNIAYGNRDSLEIIEANSTLATALLLQKRLEEQGATVFLTRTIAGLSSFGKSFETWYNEKYPEAKIIKRDKKRKPIIIPKPNKRKVFVKEFNPKDLAFRAQLINNFKPDITIIIHYNADENNEPWIHPTEKNFNMIFIPPLRYTVDTTNVLFKPFGTLADKNLLLAEKIIEQYEKKLDVPTALQEDATYLKDKCEPTKVKGVYIRQLALIKMIKGVVIYGETLYQDNFTESNLLNTRDKKINEIEYSTRIAQVAAAYYDGIINYFNILKNAY